MPYYPDGRDPFHHDPFYAEVFGADVPLVIAPGKEAEYKRWLTKEWFKEPAWKNGPPRWQIGVAGTAVGVGIIFLGLALGKK